MTGAAGRARIEAYIGASGSGKGVSIKRRLSDLKPARLLVWDPRDEYGRHADAVRELPELVRRVAAAGAGPFRLRYVPGGAVSLRDAFGVVCRLAFAAGNLVLLAEELSDVTAPSWAPPAWRQVTTQGRHRGLHVLGAAQRPAMIDKAFLANCTRIRCGALAYAPDRRAMATELDLPPAVVDRLQATPGPAGGAVLAMVERDRTEGRVSQVWLSVNAAGRVTERREALKVQQKNNGIP